MQHLVEVRSMKKLDPLDHSNFKGKFFVWGETQAGFRRRKNLEQLGELARCETSAQRRQQLAAPAGQFLGRHFTDQQVARHGDQVGQQPSEILARFALRGHQVEG